MIRVIPRDLFNDANLLKCLGTLWIKLDNWRDHDARLEQTDEGQDALFDIQQSEGDGATYVANLRFSVRGEAHWLCRPLNSREPWPLWIEADEGSIPVFTDEGELSPEFIEFVSPVDGSGGLPSCGSCHSTNCEGECLG